MLSDLKHFALFIRAFSLTKNVQEENNADQSESRFSLPVKKRISFNPLVTIVLHTYLVTSNLQL